MANNTSRSSWNSAYFSWRGTRIVPKAYNKSERLGLEFWDPRRLASHVLATFFPVDRRAEAAKFILEMKIAGSFLQRYTHQIEELLPEGDGKLVRAIARTISETFWVPQYEPPAYDRYSLREISEDLRASQTDSDFIPSVAGQEPAPWMQDEACAASGAQVLFAEPEAAMEDRRFPLLEPVDLNERAMSACTSDEARVEVRAGHHDEVDECKRNGGGVDDDGDHGGGIISRPLLSYWTRSSLAVATGPGSTFWDWHSTWSRGTRGDGEATVSETGHMAVSGGAGVSTSMRGGQEAAVLLGWMSGFVDLSYL